MRANHFDDSLEQATRARLARLADAPVDTSRLECRLAEAMTRTGRVPVARTLRWQAPLAGVAALVVVAVTIGILFFVSNETPIVATSSLLADLHREVVEGGTFSIPAASIDHANQAITARWSDAPTLPRAVDCEVRSCCIHEVDGRKIACVLLRLRGKPVTMVVAHSKDLTPAGGIEATRDNPRYAVYTKGGVNMVCMRKNGISVWLVGEFPHEELAQLLPKEWTTS